RPGRAFDADDAATAQAFASQAALALHNAQLHRDLQRGRDFLRSIAENSADAIITTDVEGQITYFSPGAEAMSGVSTGAAVQRSLADVLDGADAAGLIAQVLRNREVRDYEASFSAADGRRIDIHGSLALLRDAVGGV